MEIFSIFVLVLLAFVVICLLLSRMRGRTAAAIAMVLAAYPRIQGARNSARETSVIIVSSPILLPSERRDIDGLATTLANSEAGNAFWTSVICETLGLSVSWAQATDIGGCSVTGNVAQAGNFAMVQLFQMRRGRVGFCVATQLARLEHRWDDLPMPPDPAVGREHPYAWDLNILGRASVVHRIGSPRFQADGQQHR